MFTTGGYFQHRVRYEVHRRRRHCGDCPETGTCAVAAPAHISGYEARTSYIIKFRSRRRTDVNTRRRLGTRSL